MVTDDMHSQQDDGRTLAALLAGASQGFEEARVLAWADDVADAIDAAAGAGDAPPLRVDLRTIVLDEHDRASLAPPSSERDLLLELLRAPDSGPDDPVRDLAAVIYTMLAACGPVGRPAPIAGVSLSVNHALLAALTLPVQPFSSARELVAVLLGQAELLPPVRGARRRLAASRALGSAVVVTAVAALCTGAWLWFRPAAGLNSRQPDVDTARLDTPPASALAVIEQAPLASPNPSIGEELAAVDREINLEAARRALAEGETLRARLPVPIYDQLEAEADGLARGAVYAEQLLDDGFHAESREALEQAVESMALLLARHADAADAAALAARQWQQVEAAQPEHWLHDHAIHDTCADAYGLAGDATRAATEGRFDDAIIGYDDARSMLGEAAVLNAERVDELLAEVERQREAGEFGPSFDRLDEIAPLLDAQTERETRIQGLLAMARDRKGRLTRRDAREAVAAVLELDPDHNEALALRSEIAAARTARQGDVLVNSISQTLIYVESGVYWMGSPRTELYHQPTEQRREVHLSDGFWMTRVEVTRGQFAAFVRATGYLTDAERQGWALGLNSTGRWQRVEGLSWRRPGFQQTGNHPVTCVSWRDATAFCRWLSDREERVYRLPTEAEWEYACRAGTRSAYVWGQDPYEEAARCNGADEAWHREVLGPEGFQWFDGYTYTSPVATFPANDWGLFDMHANVQEWCEDVYGDYDPANVIDPVRRATGPNDMAPRVLRGGSFAAPPPACRSAGRDASRPDACFTTVGFRVVMED